MNSETDDQSRLEQADVVAGVADVGTGVVALSRSGPTRVEFSVVNGRAIFEGDIELGAPGELEMAERAFAAAAGEMNAAVVADTSKRWPGGRVAYEPLPTSSPLTRIVSTAMTAIASRTPIQFVPRTPADIDYLAFEVAAFCSSRVGRSGGRQVVRLSPEASTGNAIHELCHTLGLWHEQSRRDRDSYVRVRWENVLAGYEHNFRQQLTDGDDVGPYDFGSVMHYPPDAFSANGQPTLEALVGHPAFGQRDGLSDGDTAAIGYLYGAPPAMTDGHIEAGVGNGVQFRAAVPPGQTVRIMTDGWAADRVVHWDVVCTDGPASAGPLLSWQYEVGRSEPDRVDYYFTITNLAGQAVVAEARYVILREG